MGIKAYSLGRGVEIPLGSINDEKDVIIDVSEPSKEDLYFLQKIGIESQDIQDSLDENEIARISKKENYIYIILKMPYKDEYFRRTTIGIFFLEDKVVIIKRRKISIIEEIICRCVKERILSRNIFLHKIFDGITKYLLEETKRMNHETERFRDVLYKREEYISLLVWDLKENANTFMNIYEQDLEVLRLILEKNVFRLEKTEREMFEDLYYDFLQLGSMLNRTLQTLEAIFQAFHTLLSHDINKKIELLTIITIVLSIPTIISSIYGMNFLYLPLKTHPLGFLIVVIFTIFLTILSYYLFRWLLH